MGKEKTKEEPKKTSKKKGSSKKKKEEKKSRKWLKRLLIFIGFLIVCAIAFMVMQKDIFFYPAFDKEAYNWLKTKDSFEEIEILTIDEDSVASSINMNRSSLYGWIKFNKPKTEKAPLIIFFGGNASNSATVMKRFEEDGLFDTTFKDYNFMYIDYPGYGKSDGEPSDKTLFDGGIKTYDYAKMQSYVDKDHIVVVGYSIGTGVATYVASKENSKGLILVAPYDRGLSLYNNAINSFYGPMKSFARYKFNSAKEADKILCEGLIITSRDDETIDYHLSLNLADAFEIEPEVMVLEGVTHNQYFWKKDVLDKIKEYLDKNLPEEMEYEDFDDGSQNKVHKRVIKPRVLY